MGCAKKWGVGVFQPTMTARLSHGWAIQVLLELSRGTHAMAALYVVGTFSSRHFQIRSEVQPILKLLLHCFSLVKVNMISAGKENKNPVSIDNWFSQRSIVQPNKRVVCFSVLHGPWVPSCLQGVVPGNVAVTQTQHDKTMDTGHTSAVSKLERERRGKEREATGERKGEKKRRR